MIAIPQQLAAITASTESFTLIVLILGALFTLIGGSYLFTWRAGVDAKQGRDDLWDAIKDLYTNDLKHIHERLWELENEKTRKNPPA